MRAVQAQDTFKPGSDERRSPSLPEPHHKRAFETIIDSLRTMMATGELKPGDRLPAERDLAQHFGVSRTSVREALRVLETLGVVSVRRGAEHGAVLMAEPTNAFGTVVGLLMDLRHISPAEVLELRLMLELGAARRVAAQRDPETLAGLHSIVEQMESPQTTEEGFRELDATFHIALLKATGNRLVDLVEAGLDSALRRIITDASLAWRDEADLRIQITSQHREILAALEDGDGETAAQLLAQHIQQWGSRIVGLAG